VLPAGPDNSYSFRCYAANTHTAGQTVTGKRVFRAYCTNTHAAAATLTSNALRSSVAVGVGTISLPSALDLSLIGSRATTQDDIMHVSIRCDKPNSVVEGRILLDYNLATTTSLPALDANAFLQNYFLFSFRPNDLTPAVAGSTSTILAQQVALQRQQIEDSYRVWARQSSRTVENFDGSMPTPPQMEDFSNFTPVVDTTQADTGESQWTEFQFKISDLVRVGTDSSRDLKDIAAIRIELTTSATVVLDVDSWWVGGGYGPDNSQAGNLPYFYCYRGRSSLTGATGNPSPPTRNGITAERGQVSLTLTQHSDSQVDKLDIFRFGGTLNEWKLLATIANSATPTFTDSVLDDTLVDAAPLDFDNFAAFPQLDVPRSGTCDVVGTTITRLSGDTFNTSWARGSVIVIDGQPHTLYSNPSSSSKAEIEDNGGTLSGVSFYLPGATLLSQPLPAVWGPYGEGSDGIRIFGCGSQTQPGTVFWTKGNNPDSCPEANFLEITSSSEPLQAGCIYDGRLFVFSTERQFSITPAGDSFVAQPIAHALGLASRWGVCVGEHIYFIGKDGIYESDGGQSVSITDEDLYPLFPHDGQDGVTINSVPAPDYAAPEKMSLSHHNGMIYFDYQAKGIGGQRTLVYDTRIKSWSADVYVTGVRVHYGDEGVSNSLLVGNTMGSLAQMLDSATTDEGTTITVNLKTGVQDLGDNRVQKFFGDLAVDTVDSGGPTTLTVTSSLDDDAIVDGPTNITIGAVRAQKIVELASGSGRIARNLAIELQWTSSTLKVYGWQPSFTLKVETRGQSPEDWTDDGYVGAKFIQGLVLNADTLGVAKSLQVQYDGGSVGAAISATHSGEIEKPYSFVPFIAHNLRLAGVDTTPWRCYNKRWIWEPAPELTTSWITQATTHDLQGYMHLRDCYIALQSTAIVTLTINVDGTDYSYSIPSTGGAYLKTYLVLRPAKGKLFSYSLTSSAGFRLYQRDCEIRVKGWGDAGPYRVMQPFGDLSRLNGARI
jgi:hypothetical protein